MITANRRDFIKSLGLLPVGVRSTYRSSLFAGAGPELGAAGLADHVVDFAETVEVEYRWPRFVGKNGRIGDHGQHKQCTVLRLSTDQGAVGWGLSDRSVESQLSVVKGKSLPQLIAPGRGTEPGVPKECDFALHDLMGVVLQKPVYQLLGSLGTTATPVYSGMIYLDELNPDNPSRSIDRVLSNCQWDVDYGYRQLKVKVGRSGRWYPHDEGLNKDIEVIKAIHQAFAAKGVELLVDANDMYSLQDTKDFLDGIGDIPLVWVEEPFPENREEGRQLRTWMNENGFKGTLYADGEYRPNHEQCMSLAREGIIDVFLPDTYGYGFSNWINLMPKLKSIGTLSSPHTWGNRLKTNYTAHLAAGLGNVVTVEGVTCFSDDIDYGDYPIRDGKLHVSAAPGFGMKLLKR